MPLNKDRQSHSTFYDASVPNDHFHAKISSLSGQCFRLWHKISLVGTSRLILLGVFDTMHMPAVVFVLIWPHFGEAFNIIMKVVGAKNLVAPTCAFSELFLVHQLKYERLLWTIQRSLAPKANCGRNIDDSSLDQPYINDKCGRIGCTWNFANAIDRWLRVRNEGTGRLTSGF